MIAAMSAFNLARISATILLLFTDTTFAQWRLAKMRIADADHVTATGIIDELPSGGSLLEQVNVENEDNTYIPVTLEDMARNGINVTGLAEMYDPKEAGKPHDAEGGGDEDQDKGEGKDGGEEGGDKDEGEKDADQARKGDGERESEDGGKPAGRPETEAATSVPL